MLAPSEITAFARAVTEFARYLAEGGLRLAYHHHPGTVGAARAEIAAFMTAAQPFGRRIKADGVARLTLFLLSADSGVMTGAVIDHDQMVIGAYD